MKKLLYLGLAALMMLLIMTGFAQAAPQLTFTGINSSNQYGKYVPIRFTLTDNGTQLQNFELYYCTGGGTPSKSAYNPNNDEIIRVVASGTTAEIIFETDAVPYFKAIAYPAGSNTASNLVSKELTALYVEDPSFDVAGSRVVEVDKNTVVRIIDHAGGSEIFYTTDGTTLPLKSAFGKDSKVFKYNDATGITITENMTIQAIAFKTINGQEAGSGLLRMRFNLGKPKIRVALSASEYTIGTEAPTVNLTIPDGFTLGTQSGNFAVNLLCRNNGFSQVITQNGVALDMSLADAASREDEWVINCMLVKGDKNTELYTGNVDLTPEVISLEILKNGERPAIPVFSVPSGPVYKGSKVEILCATPGATIYYTTQDEDINTLYKGPITINQDCSFRAMAEKDGLSSYRTGVAKATYTIIKEDPAPDLTATLTPGAGSQIDPGTEITITTSVAVDKILFKLYEKAEDIDKDQNFNTTATEYSSTTKPVPTWQNPILRIGLMKDQQWKYFSYSYSFKTGSEPPATETVASPMFSPVAGQVEKGTKISLDCVTPGAKIHYTVDGSVPTAESSLYAEPIEINEATTIKAIATKEGWANSRMAEASYTVKGNQPDQPKVTLTFNPTGGSTVKANTEVTISASNGNAEIVYMMFSSEKEARETEWDQKQEELYRIEMKPVVTMEKNTIKATYSLDGETRADTFFYATYTVVPLQAVRLFFSPASGSIVEDGEEIKVTAFPETDVFYMVYADSMAAVASADMFIRDAKVIADDGNPVITKGNTFLKCGAYDESAGTMRYFYASYKINGEQEFTNDTVTAPTFSVPAGEVKKGTKVEISCAMSDVMIFYTLNGDEPMVTSLLYSEPIEINESVAIKAIAFKIGMKKSKVSEAAYTVQGVANEDKELAGVSIYPNPNEGEFNVRVPVKVLAEVFSSNGVVVKKVDMKAGVNALRLENSGIYFIRFTAANGEVAIKKVMVR